MFDLGGQEYITSFYAALYFITDLWKRMCEILNEGSRLLKFNTESETWKSAACKNVFSINIWAVFLFWFSSLLFLPAAAPRSFTSQGHATEPQSHLAPCNLLQNRPIWCSLDRCKMVQIIRGSQTTWEGHFTEKHSEQPWPRGSDASLWPEGRQWNPPICTRWARGASSPRGCCSAEISTQIKVRGKKRNASTQLFDWQQACVQTEKTDTEERWVQNETEQTPFCFRQHARGFPGHRVFRSDGSMMRNEGEVIISIPAAVWRSDTSRLMLAFLRDLTSEVMWHSYTENLHIDFYTWDHSEKNK